MIIIFPWPPKELSPNARVHWTKKHRAAKAYKGDCLWICKAAKPKSFSNELKIIFDPPSRRKADADNMLASFKYGIDAIAEYLGVDDSRFHISFSKDEPVKNGQVRVLIS